MFCPKCESEYRPGFDRCADCDLPLVDALPLQGPHVSKELVPAFSTTETSDLSYIASTLDAAGIPHVIEQEHATLTPKRALTHVLVPEDRYEDAITLLESRTPLDLQRDEPGRKFQDTGAEPRPNSLAQETGSFDLHTFARFVIIGGLVVLGLGTFKLLMNLPVTYENSGKGYLMEMGQQMAISDANLIRASNREEAINWLVGGAIVIFIGFAVSASTVNNSSDFRSDFRGPGGKRSQSTGKRKSGA